MGFFHLVSDVYETLTTGIAYGNGVREGAEEFLKDKTWKATHLVSSDPYEAQNMLPKGFGKVNPKDDSFLKALGKKLKPGDTIVYIDDLASKVEYYSNVAKVNNLDLKGFEVYFADDMKKTRFLYDEASGTGSFGGAIKDFIPTLKKAGLLVVGGFVVGVALKWLFWPSGDGSKS